MFLARLSKLSPKSTRFLLSSIRCSSSTHPTSTRINTDEQKAQNTTHFGYQTVAEADKERLVGTVFGNVASKYDIMNDLMSAGVHRVWKNRLIQMLSPMEDTQLLDVAGGTGDIAFRYLDHVRNFSANYHGDAAPYSAHVTVLDINAEMLKVGQQRADKLGYNDPVEIDWVCANAEQLPIKDASMDAYTIAFGIRNCTHIDKVLSEAYRVLKPGGRFMCLEFGRVQQPLVSSLYDLFSFEIIPKIGQVVAQDGDSYKYLVESIRKFPPQPVFAEMIKTAGFKQVEWEDLTFGVAAIHSGWKDSDK